MRNKTDIQQLPKINISDFQAVIHPTTNKDMTNRRIKRDDYEKISRTIPKGINHYSSRHLDLKNFKLMGNRNKSNSTVLLPHKRLRSLIPFTQSYQSTQDIKKREDWHDSITILKKIGICAVICVIIIIIKNIKLPIFQNAVYTIKSAITNQFDIDKTLGKLKFVSNYIPSLSSVFNSLETTTSQLSNKNNTDILTPIEGHVLQKFSQQSQGIKISGADYAYIRAATDGLVSEVGNNEKWGNYIVIRHNSGMEMRYAYCTKCNVKKGMNVIQNEIIGSIGSSKPSLHNILYFEVRINNQPIDPMSKIINKNMLSL